MISLPHSEINIKTIGKYIIWGSSLGAKERICFWCGATAYIPDLESLLAWCASMASTSTVQVEACSSCCQIFLPSHIDLLRVSDTARYPSDVYSVYSQFLALLSNSGEFHCPFSFSSLRICGSPEQISVSLISVPYRNSIHALTSEFGS